MPKPKAGPTILFEDEILLVINKPAGLVVHPAPSHKGPTLMDWVKEYLGPHAAQNFEESDRLGLVHRLDKDTTGVLVITKTPESKTAVGRQFHDRIVKKQYVAFTEGVPARRIGTISAPVGRSKKVRSRMAVTGDGRPAETSFEVAEKLKEVALVKLFPKTGRTHQLRVHCAAIGHPIVGDITYGAREKWSRERGITRPLLHAESLEMAHPISGKTVHFVAPWPKDMKEALSLFRRAAKVALVLVAFVSNVAVFSSANEPTKKKTTKPPSSSGSGSGEGASASSKQISSLKAQFKALIEEVSALQDRMTGIEKNLEDLDLHRRLKDLEKALADLNGKTTGSSASADETKTQTLDLARKVRVQQDTLDQLRDQIDRLQRQMIQLKSRDEATVPEPEPVKSQTREGSRP